MLITIDEVARRSYSSNSTVRRRIASGELPAFHNGRKRYVREEDVDGLFEPVEVTERDRVDGLEKRIRRQLPHLGEDSKRRLASLFS